jgi:hypothetical protein
MKHSVTPLVGGKPATAQDYDQRSPARVSESCPPCISCGRPFETYVDQPDTAERTRLAVQAIPFALPEKRDE